VRRFLDSTEIEEGQETPSGLRTRHGKFLYQGAPIYLVGSGLEGITRFWGYDGRDLEVWRKYIAMLSEIQAEHVRFRLRINLWAFAYDPQGPSFAPWQWDGERFDLGQFNDAHWSLLNQIAREASDAGILVEIVLFDATALTIGKHNDPWSRNPFNAALNGPLSGPPRPHFYNLSDPHNCHLFEQSLEEEWSQQRRIQYHQQRLVHRAIRCLDGLENVCWEIVGEIEGADPVRVGFVEHWISFLRKHDPMDRLVSFSGKSPLRGDEVYYHLTGIDTVHAHLTLAYYDPHEDMVETISALSRYGKPVIFDETDWTAAGAGLNDPLLDEMGPTWERWSFWQAFIAGGYTSADCCRSLARRPVHDWLKVFMQFVEGTEFHRLEYRPDLPITCPSECYAHAALGTDEAVIYLTADRPMQTDALSLKLPVGRWKVIWVDPKTGRQTVRSTSLEADSGESELRMPAFEEDLILHLKKQAQ
jgi:hypothetical protein